MSGSRSSSRLSARRLALLRRMRDAGEARGPSPPSRTPETVEAGVLSVGEEQLWFLHRMEPLGDEYHMPFVLRFREGLRPADLGRALGRLAERHEALRTTFPEAPDRPGRPMRRVHARGGGSARPAICAVDLATLSTSRADREAARTLETVARERFDLASGPLVRAAAVLLPEKDHRLLLVLHHIVADGRSIRILLEELDTLYGVPAPEREAALPSPSADYREFAAWQRDWLKNEEVAARLARWRERLGGELPPLDLPTDRPRSHRSMGEGGTVPVTLEADTVARLEGLARELSGSPFGVLAAVYQVLLHRLTGQERFGVGTSVANRDRPGFGRTVGFFANMAVLDAELTGALPFRRVAEGAIEAVRRALADQAIPFERFVQELVTERDPSRNPLFQVSFSFRSEASADPAGLESEELATRGVKFDLTLELTAGPDGAHGKIWFRRDLFDRTTVGRIAANFERLASAASSSPGSPVLDLSLLSAGERQQVVVEWAWGPGWPGERGAGETVDLAGRFLKRSLEVPERVALVWEGERWSYGALAARVAALHEELTGRGVGPEVRVGVFVERRPELVVALLAVLSSGGCYVPLDPAYPEARIVQILEDSEARWVLSRGSSRWRLPSESVPVLELEAMSPSMGDRATVEAALASAGSSAPESLAYAIYTSGSTGRPKGVAISRAGAAALMAWAREEFAPVEQEVVLAATSVCFDLSVFELFLPLTSGARVVLVDDALALASAPASGEATLVNTVPSAMAALVAAGPLPERVRTVNLAGEPLVESLAREIYEAGRVEVLYNLYGPSEDTTYSTVSRVPRRGVPTIGRPVSGTRAAVLDPWGRVVPVGVPGELSLSGAGLARGYLGRPGPTAERFVPDPDAGESGARRYRTGDLVRWRPDGELEFLGRIDHQVKLRGFRIELGEVESVLAAHPSVGEAVAGVRRGPWDGSRLVAWVTPGAPDRPAPDPDTIQEHVRRRLPEYMVPSVVVTLAELPRTPNGKVDRKALPAPSPDSSRGRAGGGPLAGPTEELLAVLWSDLLGVDAVAPDDDFFALGGHSLTATRVVSRIRSTLGVELPVRSLFEAPTLRRLAAWVDRSDGESRSAGPPLEPQSRPDAVPLSYAQERLWFLHRFEPGSSAYNVPAALRVRGPLEPSRLARAMAGLVERHESLRTAIESAGGLARQRVHPRGRTEMPVVDLREVSWCRKERIAREIAVGEAARPFLDLECPPLMRCALVRLAPEDHLLVLVLHHIVADWWSLGVFFRDLAILYKASLPAEGMLPPLPVQYADFALWQREWLETGGAASQVEYWREALHGVEPLELPTDRPRPAVRAARGGAVPLELPRSLEHRLDALCGRLGATPFMIFLAVFQVLLARLAGRGDVQVGAPVANRTRSEIEDLIGFFVNTLVLRTDLSDDPELTEAVRRVRMATLGASEHQDLPFERVVSELAPERNTSHTPLFQVLFNFQNEVPQPDLPGLEASLLALDSGTSKYDLSLSVGRSGDGWIGALGFDATLFDRTSAQRFGRQLTQLLVESVAEPERKASTLPLLGAVERSQLLIEWNDTAQVPPARWKGLHELVLDQAAAAPDASAVVCDERRLSYGQLAAAVDRLAEELRALGVGPEDRVGLLLPASVEMVVGIFGILTAGGAYVPLDPSWPGERTRTVLEDAGVERVVTLPELSAELPEGATAVGITAAFAGGPVVGKAPGARPAARPVAPSQAAYVLYTSGSTGTPKGVVVEHRQIVHYAGAIWRRLARLGLEDGASFATVSPPTADLGNTSLFGALTRGGCLHVIPRQRAFDRDALTHELEAHTVDCLKIVPSHLAALLGEDGPAPLPRRVLILGGEAAGSPLLARVRRRSPGLEILNHYGPTETTVGVSTRRLRPGETIDPPIGSPLADTRLYVADRALRLEPVGVPGELYVAGSGVTRGYLGRPALTASRFLPDPFSEFPGDRLYATGDLVRRRADGVVQFLGRTDDQVKIRGFRVERGEIESVLAAHPAVREAAVIFREHATGDLRPAALLTVRSGPGPDPDELRAFLRERLPEQMIPVSYTVLDELPLSANGKIDRRALARCVPRIEASDDHSGPTPAETGNALEPRIATIWCDLLRLEQVGRDRNFFDVGGHSLLVVQLQERLRLELDVDVSVIDLFTWTTVREQARFLGGAESAAPAPVAARVPVGSAEGGPIAVIGMSGRFPGARNLDEYWHNLVTGVESIRSFSDAEEETSAVAPELLHAPGYVNARGVLEDVEMFDAAFFDFRPREAELTDPQQRLFLECAWEALENSGHDPERSGSRVGVYASAGRNGYFLHHLFRNPRVGTASHGLEARVGNDKDFLATRLSYKLGLRGPSVAVQTSCSSSLVAVHMACRSLQAGECDAAVAGGVRISLPQRTGYLYEEGGVVSPDGHCRAFDARARGMVPGNGVGVVVLKRLEDALADRDPIRAVIRGSAVNNDGRGKAGYTAPGVEGQARVIAAAWEEGGVDPDAVGYVEAHGTGTPVGDPIEVAALTRVFRSKTDRRGFCVLGSVKTNIGHLDTAAGIAGLIKTVLVLEHGTVPPTLHFERPNPELRLDESPLRVNTTPVEWRRGERLRYAGVSSFGIGGTNAHVVLEEAPAAPPTEPVCRPEQLLVLSGRTASAVKRSATALAEHLEGFREVGLADAAYTLQVGRKRFPYRVALLAVDRGQGIRALREVSEPGRALAEHRRAPVFLFPGQGAQHPGMGGELYATERVFRSAVDHGARVLEPALGLDLRQLLFPEGETARREAAARLAETRFTQPALFVIENALARLWLDWGVEPAALIGHSIGELVAACVSGVLSTSDALVLVAERGRLMDELPPGAMLAVSAGEEEVRSFLGNDADLAAVNGRRRVTVSGSPAGVERVAGRLREAGLEARSLRVSHAFHSRMMEPAVEAFAARASEVRLRPPSIPFVSNLTGTWITDEQASDPRYWGEHLRGTVQFARGLETLDGWSREVGDAEPILLEVGPGRTLSTLAGRRAVASLPHAVRPRSARRTMLEALGRLWEQGIEPDWERFQAGARQRLRLPTYPFERRSYWVPPADVEHSDRGEILRMAVWRQAPGATGRAGAGQSSIHAVVGGAPGLAERVVEGLRARDRTVAGAFETPDDAVDRLRSSDLPALPIRMALLAPPGETGDGAAALERLVRALEDLDASTWHRVDVVVWGTREVTGEEDLSPACLRLAEAAARLAAEGRTVRLGTVDLATSRPIDRAAERLIDELARPVGSGSTADTVALRGPHRWVRAEEAIPEIQGDDGVLPAVIGLVTPQGVDGSPWSEALAQLGVEVRTGTAVRPPEREAVDGVLVLPGSTASEEEPVAARLETLERVEESLGSSGAAPGWCLVLSRPAGGSNGTSAATDELFARLRNRRNGPLWSTLRLAGGTDSEVPGDRVLRRMLSWLQAGTEPLFGAIPRSRRDGAADRPGSEPGVGKGLERDHDRPEELPASYVAPRTETEELVAAAWSEAFGFARIGVEDDFFDLGGDSLLATRIAGRLRDTFGVELNAAVLFEAGTISGVAAAVDASLEKLEDVDRSIAETLESLESLTTEEIEAMVIEERRERGSPAAENDEETRRAARETRRTTSDE